MTSPIFTQLLPLIMDPHAWLVPVDAFSVPRATRDQVLERIAAEDDDRVLDPVDAGWLHDGLFGPVN